MEQFILSVDNFLLAGKHFHHVQKTWFIVETPPSAAAEDSALRRRILSGLERDAIALRASAIAEGQAAGTAEARAFSAFLRTKGLNDLSEISERWIKTRNELGKGTASWNVPGLPEPLREGAQFIEEHGGIVSSELFNSEFKKYPGDVFKKSRYLNWKGWMKKHILLKKRTAKLI